MNKRDKFWIYRLLWFLGIIVVFTVLSFYNIIQFDASYMEEEKAELKIFQKQIEWAIMPYLKEKNYGVLREYCEDFAGEDVKFQIFDKNKNLIASSKGYEDTSIDLYTASVKDKMIGVLKEYNINGETYYLELSISEDDVLKSITTAQNRILLLFACCLAIFLISLIYFFQKIRVPFDSLEGSVIKIANGDLDTKIEVSSVPILQDLTLAIKKMTKRLKNQIDKLKKLEQYKTDFINNISHEIKTPITVINTAVELIKEKDAVSDAQSKECFDMIQFQVKFINVLVNDILSLAELEEEKLNESKDFKRVVLNDIIKDAVNCFENIDINIFANNLLELYGDERLLFQAVVNLLSNAQKYSRSEKVDVILDQDDKNIFIKVKDYGVGIEKYHLERIFEKFYRIDKSGSRKNGGTGLGLAIVKNITELHGGKVSVESKIGEGTGFILTFPKNI